MRLLLLLALLTLSVSNVHAQSIPDEVTVRVAAIINLPGRYSYLITTGRRAYFITDASRAYWGAGPGKLCHLLENSYGGYDAHCAP